MKDFTWQHLDTEHHVNLRYFYSANMAACLCLLGRLRLHSWWDFFLSVIKYRGIQSAKCLPALLYHNWNNEFCYMKPSTIISQNYCKSLSMRHGFKNGNPLNFSSVSDQFILAFHIPYSYADIHVGTGDVRRVGVQENDRFASVYIYLYHISSELSCFLKLFGQFTIHRMSRLGQSYLFLIEKY